MKITFMTIALAVTMLMGAQSLQAQDIVTPEQQALMGQQTVTDQQTKIQAEAEKQPIKLLELQGTVGALAKGLAADIKEAISKADVIVLTLPLSEKTESLVDEAFLSCLKQDCVLVNISRGKIIDTDALTDALSKHKISAALDVFEDEPLAEDSPLWSMENVIITPHNSFVGEGNGERLRENISTNLRVFILRL